MKTAEHIIETVDKLVRKYHTRDPYELCQLLGIKIHYYDLQKKLKESGCWMSEIRKEWKTMKEYEVIWEIFNKCPRNQMRDVFVEEVEIADPEEYVRHKFQGKDVSYDKTVLPDGTIVFDIVTSQIKQRCSFTEI